MPVKQSFMTALTDTWTDAADGDPLGSIRWENNKAYKCVQFNNGAGDVASIAGDVAYYYAVSGAASATTGYLNHLVTMDLTDTHEIAAGIFQAIIADGDRGWIQIKGAATLTQALTAGADGDPLTATGAGADGALDVTAADTSPIVGFADDASAKVIICDFPF